MSLTIDEAIGVLNERAFQTRAAAVTDWELIEAIQLAIESLRFTRELPLPLPPLFGVGIRTTKVTSRNNLPPRTP